MVFFMPPLLILQSRSLEVPVSNFYELKISLTSLPHFTLWSYRPKIFPKTVQINNYLA